MTSGQFLFIEIHHSRNKLIVVNILGIESSAAIRRDDEVAGIHLYRHSTKVAVTRQGFLGGLPYLSHYSFYCFDDESRRNAGHERNDDIYSEANASRYSKLTSNYWVNPIL